MNLAVIKPDWPAPEWVQAASTCRSGGVSQGVYQAMNVGDHVGDDAEHVATNRQRLVEALALPSEPFWLNQTHSTDVVPVTSLSETPIEADASYSEQPSQVCAVMTADCLPVLFTDKKGQWVAAAHAGWRGLANGILLKTMDSYQGEKEDCLAWLGPAISSKAFEVGDDVKQAFCAQSSSFDRFFQARDKKGKYLADLYGIAREQLSALGVQIYGGDFCTYSDPEQFFSYRRDGVTGRMASLIWLSSGAQ
ncbi:peptidoglycan editing factor PgeF [Pleionea sp. CnH1-48]|uniref:peptidoglycan editing factor PgeF n=1 Tax=Pleionea sp. CnH1-48 TaxID=2954494 RepID=UPI002097A3BC|nr:peptidoglycan editing factor PgeF [Pleionea sp. CnH1-48]MCO7225303.1 peptidoglycan editing factor PgeF [Pleionea sp. CnH1-48]